MKNFIVLYKEQSMKNIIRLLSKSKANIKLYSDVLNVIRIWYDNIPSENSRILLWVQSQNKSVNDIDL